MKFEDVIEEKGRLIYTNKGVSMLPWIHQDKDLIVIDKISDPLKKYDVVLFRREGVTGRGAYVLHRIMKVYDNNEYYIIGDNTVSGERVKIENIIGILTSIIQSDRTIQVTDSDYRRKVWLWWHAAFPVRRCYLRGKSAAAKLARKLGLRKK